MRTGMKKLLVLAMGAGCALGVRAEEKVYRTAEPAAFTLKAGEAAEVSFSETPKSAPNGLVMIFEIRQAEACKVDAGRPGDICLSEIFADGRRNDHCMWPRLNPAQVPADGSWKECTSGISGSAPKMRFAAPPARFGGAWEVRNMRVVQSMIRPKLDRLFNRGYLEWAGADHEKFNGEWFAGSWNDNWRISRIPYRPRTWGDKRYASDPISFICVNAGKPGALQLSDAVETKETEDDGLGDMLADDGGGPDAETGVEVEIPKGDPMRYMYLMHSLVGGTPKFRMDVKFTDRKGKSKSVALKWGEDVRDWLDLETKRNCFNEHVYSVCSRDYNGDAGMLDCDAAAASTTVIAVPPELGPIASVTFVPKSDQDAGIFMVHDFFLTNARYDVNRRPVDFVKVGEMWRPTAFPRAKRGIKAGSPMDRSPKKRQTVAELGRIVSNGKGDFVFEKDPEKKPIRWLSTGGAAPIDWYDGGQDFARREKVRSHNLTREGRKNPWPEHPLVRPDWAIDPAQALEPKSPKRGKANREYMHQQIEAAIERDYRAGYRVKDCYGDATCHYICEHGGLDFDEEVMDVIFWSVKCMEDRGMYLTWNIGMNVCYPGPPWNPDQWPKEAYVSPWGDGELNKTNMERCKQATRQLLCQPNPYTGRKLIESDTLVTLLLWNESLFFKGGKANHGEIKAELRKKYGDGEEGVEKIRKAWNGEKGCWAKLHQGWDDKWESIDKIEIADWLGEKSQRGADLLEICRRVGEYRINYWRDFLRSLGFKGPITDTNMVHDFLRMQPRNVENSYVSCNTYHSHPLPSKEPYKVMHIWQDSSIRQTCWFYRGLAQGRIQGKPIVITEGDFPWMNKFRYEQAFVMNALCGMNGFSWMKSFSGGGCAEFYYEDELGTPGRAGALGNFDGRDDPVKWASEYVGWWMQTGGCVTPSDVRFRIDVPMEEVEREHLWNTGLGEESLLAFIGRVSVNFIPKGGKPAPADKSAKEIAIPRTGRGSSFAMGGAGGMGGAIEDVRFANVVLNDDGSLNVNGIVKTLKDRGWIAKENRTNPATGEFESSTGELYLNVPKLLATVNAPRMRALFTAGRLQDIPGFRITEFRPYGLAALIALDGRRIEESGEMMLVFATDAMNSGMIFDSTGWDSAVCLGRSPVLTRAGTLACEIDNANAGKFTMTALYPDGSELEDLTKLVTQKGGKLAIRLETAKLAEVSPFYYLKVEK